MDQPDGQHLPAAPAPEAPAVPSLSFVERVGAKFKGLTRSQLAICEHFISFPAAGKDQIAEACGVNVRTVEKWMAAPEFWQVVGAFDLSNMQRQQALALMSAKLSELLGRAGKLDEDDGAWLDRVAKWTGITREVPAAVAIASAGSSELSARISARAAELAAGIQAELGLDSQVERVADVTASTGNRVEHSQQAPAVGAGGGAA